MSKSSDRNDKQTKRSYIKKYRRLPNGFGQISKIKGNLRNPYRAMVTVGKTPMGKPICKLLKPKAYFKTYNEAYQALMKYHEEPFNLGDVITCNELYERWSSEHFKNIGKSRQRYESAWKYCSDKHDALVVDIRPRDIKHCMYNGTMTMKNGTVRTPSPTTQSSIKMLWSLMLDYAVEYEIVNRNYAREFSMPKDILDKQKKAYKGHKCLSKDELVLLQTNITNVYAEMAYVQCYMGWRPGELCELKTSNIDLENMIIVGGFKTDAGTDRIVPIHPAIRSIIANRYDPEHEYLYDVAYRTYRNNLVKVLPEHQVHDCRKTFITMAKDAGVNEYAIKRIVGHRISDITESVYTERNIEWLANEISKIPTVGNM